MRGSTAIVSDADKTPLLDEHSRSIDHRFADHLLGMPA